MRGGQMDIDAVSAIARASIAILIPYLKKVAEGGAADLGKQAASAVWQKAKGLYEAIRAKVMPGSTASSTLNQLSSSPANEQFAEDMRAHLQELLGNDPAFAHLLAGKLMELDQSGADSTFNTTIHGTVTKLLQAQTIIGDVKL
jgi:hypothetical protein